MADEYRIRITGDFDGLEEPLKRKLRELGDIKDNHIIIPMDYDMKIPELKKKLDEVEKMNPEIGVQFKYDFNKALLDNETKKLSRIQAMIDLDVKGAKKQFEDFIKNNLDKTDKKLKGGTKVEANQLLANYLSYDGANLDKIDKSVREVAKNLNITEGKKLFSEKDLEKQQNIVNSISNEIAELEKKLSNQIKVDVQPNSAEFIGKLQEDIKDESVGVNVEPITDDFVKQIQDDIGEQKVNVAVQPTNRKDDSEINIQNELQTEIKETQSYERERYEHAITLLKEYISLQNQINRADYDVLPQIRNGEEQRSFYINGNDTTRKSKYNNVTQASLKRVLGNYVDNPSDRDFNKLVAYTNALGDIEKAEKIFGTTHKELFEKVQNYILEATDSLKAYEKAEIDLQAGISVLKDVFDFSWTFGDRDKFENLLKTDGVESAIDFLVEKFKFEIPEAVQTTNNAINNVSFADFEKQSNAQNELQQETKETEQSFENLSDSIEGQSNQISNSVEKIDTEAQALDRLVTAAENATKAKDKFVNANERVRESAKDSTDSIDSETNAMNNVGVGNASNDTGSGNNSSSGGKKKSSSNSNNNSQYDFKKAQERAREIEEALQKQRENLGEGVITSIDRAYDSHDVLKEALLKVERVVDQDGELVKQIERINIKYDKNDNIAYTSTMTSDDLTYSDKQQQKVNKQIDANIKRREAEEQRLANEMAKGREKAVRERTKAEIKAEKESADQIAKMQRGQRQDEKLDVDLGVRKERLETLKKELQEQGLYVAKLKGEFDSLTDSLDSVSDSHGLNIWDKNLQIFNEHAKQTKSTVDNLVKSQKEQQKASPNNRNLKQEEFDKTYQEQIALLRERNKLEKEIAKNPNDTISNEQKATRINSINDEIKKLEEVREKLIDENKYIAANAEQEEKINDILDVQKRELEQISADLKQRYSDQANSWDKMLGGMMDDPQYTENYKNKLEDLRKKVSIFKNDLNNLDSDDIKNLTREFNELGDGIERVARQEKKLAENKAAAQTSLEKLKLQIADFTEKNSKMGKAFKEQFDSLSERLDGAKTLEEVRNITAEIARLKTEVTNAGKTGLNFFDGLKNRMKSIAQSAIAMAFSFYDVIRYVRQAFEVVHEFDDALTEMRKVSDESVNSLKSYQQASFDVASSIGSTALALQQSTADWMRLGESMEEAAESAKIATILLNVSEFDSIESATEALVSASQAYNDLDKMDIVDVLNNIGNNYSVSTDQLAEGLQNAAAVLKTQNNELEETVALLTAGNAITQDMSKTSSGIRTIALRIAGTEEAKGQLAELGEEVDDFVVQTASKTQAIIKDYTAVASNARKGVDVLDANGNLRNTYDILLDISKVYQEILDEDKKAGTNRGQALVEALAGKNRANIASSILLNPEMLENVYNSALNSSGSALEENEKYLDSISGKIEQIKNTASEIAFDFANTEGLKTLLDIFNSLLKVIDAIVDSGAAIPTILGSIGGVALFKNFDKPKRRVSMYMIINRSNLMSVLMDT